MTNFSTETEAESYEAADLARIALQAAIDAVDAYQARNGVCDAPFRVTLHVDNGNGADREGTFDLPEIDEPNEALRRAAASHDRYTGRDGWIRHDGDITSPVETNRRIDACLSDGRVEWNVPAGLTLWSIVEYYRPAEDA